MDEEDTKSGRPRNPSGRRSVQSRPPKNVTRSSGHRWLSMVGWTCCITAILYGAVQALSRTDGFRSLLADRLSDRLGVPLSIGGSRLDWRLNVTLEQIQTKQGADPAVPAVGAARVEICWNWSHNRETGMIRALTVDGARIRLVQGIDGDWAPACLAPLAEKVTRLGQLGMLNAMMSRTDQKEETPDDAETAEPGDGARNDLLKNINVVIHDAQVVWWSGDQQVASISGLDFLSRNVEFPGRAVQYYRVEADEAAMSAGRSIQNISFEMLSTAGRNIILGPKASWHSVEPDEPKQAVEEKASQEEALLAHAESVIQRSREYVYQGVTPPEKTKPVSAPAEIATPKPITVATATVTPVPTVTPTAVPVPVATATPLPTATPKAPAVPTPLPTMLPDPMKQALETFAAAQGVTNTAGEHSPSDGLNDDESEALILYIKEMLESGE